MLGNDEDTSSLWFILGADDRALIGEDLSRKLASSRITRLTYM